MRVGRRKTILSYRNVIRISGWPLLTKRLLVMVRIAEIRRGVPWN